MVEGMSSSEQTSERAEFDALFLELTGIDPDTAGTNDEGFLFVPPTVPLGEEDSQQRGRISDLAGPNGWKNHLVDDEYAGWWIRRPE